MHGVRKFDNENQDIFSINYPLFLDVEIHHLEKRSPLKFSDIKVVANGPLRAAVNAEVTFGKSKALVTVSATSLLACLTMSR